MVSISVVLLSKRQTSGTEENENDDILNSGLPLLLVPSRSIEVHKKYLAALSMLEKQGVNHPGAGRVVRALFDPATITQDSPIPLPSKQQANFIHFNDGLDDSQIEAIQFALSETRQISCIHGPPGTGKTTTLVELIRQAANSILNKMMRDGDSQRFFDMVVIDEGAQALEAACWIPALRGKRLVLAGDHRQLPPTIQSNQPQVAKGLGTTMFERISGLYSDDDPKVVTGEVS